MPADNETPQPAPCGSAKMHEAHYLPLADEGGVMLACCPGIAAPITQQSAGAWKMTDEQALAVSSKALEMFEKDGDHRSMHHRFVEAAVRLGIVAPCIVRGSRDHDPKESAGAIPDFDGEASQKPELCPMCYGRRVVETIEPAPDDGLDLVLGSAPCPHCAPETKSLDADPPGPSAARAELGPISARPDEGAGPSESVRHAARRESRDAGLTSVELDAIRADYMTGHDYRIVPHVPALLAEVERLRAALVSQRSEEKR